MSAIDDGDDGQPDFPEWNAFLGGGRRSREGFPIRKVVKRSGAVADYDRRKIEDAIGRAVAAVQGRADPDKAQRLTDAVEARLRLLLAGRHEHSIPAIEEIQDTVEAALIEGREAAVAKAYILYREHHAALRGGSGSATDAVDGYLSRSGGEAPTAAGLARHCAAEAARGYWLSRVYPPDVAGAHRRGELHIHGLAMLAGRRAAWSMAALAGRGPAGAGGDAADMAGLLDHAASLLEGLCGEWEEGVALASPDTCLAPLAKAEGLDEAAVGRLLRRFVLRLNAPGGRAADGGAPRVALVPDWTCPPALRERRPVVGGREAGFAYGDCQPEMDMVNRQLLSILLEGDAGGRGFATPFPVCTPGYAPAADSPCAALLFQLAAKYGTPLFLGKGAAWPDGTGSIGMITADLSRLERDDAAPYARLDRLLALARSGLAAKREFLGRQLGAGFFPLTGGLRLDAAALSASIGIRGLREYTLASTGAEPDAPGGRDFAAALLGHIRGLLRDYQREDGTPYLLEAPPPERAVRSLAAAAPLLARTDGPALLHLDVPADGAACRSLIEAALGTYRLPAAAACPSYSVCPRHGYLPGEHAECPRCREERRAALAARLAALQEERAQCAT